ncbi:SIR2 family NAD-dependent protein deacylase [Gynurincola endophyticus]|jgi:NAD-dependent deacetylase|uniref:SIR2 family NAD-dependent protein deacylase n=1 Tax=Gynurincola endophyticus TaxID=2479004 RepID=UPI000F8D9C8D|nr:Sir2 family NAD-dependent protein deacetylase [Gynurincola endophyticus]
MKHIVVLSGAGISAESGLQTFRDADGLWNGYEITEVATPGAWKRNPALVLDFYNMRRQNVLGAEPNQAHRLLADLEQQYKVTIITQNIDDLHERAGSTNILHLHGEILKMRSEKDESLVYDIRGDIHLGNTAADGAQLRPHIVWFEEAVPMIEPAIGVMQTADIFIIIGTSLAVYPAAGLGQYAFNATEKYIIDKRIPSEVNLKGYEAIEATATAGMEILHKKLMK